MRALTKLHVVIAAARRSIVIHLAHLSAGTARHRALLFKVLADSLNLMCQLQRSRQGEHEEERVVNVVQINKKVSWFDRGVGVMVGMRAQGGARGECPD